MFDKDSFELNKTPKSLMVYLLVKYSLFIK